VEAGAAVVGRESELQVIDRFLAEDTGTRALVLEGDAGIGKTALFEAAAERARSRALVLRSRPAPTEAQLSFAAASDLVAARLPAIEARLAPAQVRALEVAFRVSASVDARLDPHTVSAAFLAAIRCLASQRPLVLAIDDVQWLDEASAGVLQFALRRLNEEPVTVLVARRGGGEDPLPLDLQRSLPETRTRRIEVGRFSLGALHHLLRLRLGTTYARPTIRRLHASSGGNPFYALELARAIERRGGVVAADEPLPVPPTLLELVAERVDALARPAQDLLGYVAALSQSTLRVVETIAEREGLRGGLDDAIAAGVVEIELGQVAFTHPLLASVVYGRLGPERRRELHRALADVVPDAEEQALHLARATSNPEDAVADRLEEAAASARGRGALDAAATLLLHAAQLTPTAAPEERGRRLVAVGQLLLDGGDPRRCGALMASVADSLPRGPIRAEALTLLGWVEDDLATCERLCEQALDEARGAPRVEGRAHLQLAVIRSIQCRYADVVREAAVAARRAEKTGDVQVRALALAELGHARTFLGHGVTEESRQAAELERTAGFTGQLSGGALLGRVLAFDGQLERARTVLREELERAAAAGHDGARSTILHDLSSLEARAGNWREAEQLADDSSALAQQVSTDQMSAASLYFPALVDALLGRVDAALERSLAGLATAQRIGDVIFELKHRGVLGFIELSVGDAAAAHSWLEPATARLIDAGVRELAAFEIVENELDALVTLGLVDQADKLVTVFEDPAAPQGSTWSRLVATRGRGLVHAGRGDLDAARASLDRTLELHEHVHNPFELGRTLLARGTLERRAKRKRASKGFLDQALTIFERLPAPRWAEKARAELRRLSLRSTPGTLTATETRIAELAASGLTNREIAAAAFVSQKTVEANLSKIYRKLAVRSRIELVRRMTTAGANE
jgi:DNA-binding CsgD family transcriptional regulator